MMNRSTIAALALSIGTGISSSAVASDLPFTIPTKLSYSSAANQKSTWNTVLIVSAAVLVIGLIQEESTLALLGGAGVLVSLVQTNNLGFQAPSMPRGIDFYKSGPVSFGLSPFGRFGLRLGAGFDSFSPSPYVVANFRF